MFQKMIPAAKVYTLIVGSVEEFISRRDRINARPSRKANLRDVVGARQTPSIWETFCEEMG